MKKEVENVFKKIDNNQVERIPCGQAEHGNFECLGVQEWFLDFLLNIGYAFVSHKSFYCMMWMYQFV